MKKLTLILSFFLFIFNQTASAQCQASFTFNQQAGSNTISFVNTSTGNYSALSWYLGDGSTASSSNVTHTYAPGIYGVCLTVWDSLNGCQSTFCDTLYINTTATCQASFTTTYQGNLIQFLNNSAGPYTQVYWDFGDGTNSTIISPWHQFAQPGVYTVCLTVGDSATSCFDTYCQTISYQGTGNCDASFSSVDSAGFTWFFPTNYNPNYYYYWSFGDGNSSTQSYPIHQYATQGTFLACLTVIDSSTNCFDTFCDSVSNLPPTGCSAGFGYQVSNGTSYFNGYNTGVGSVASYSWSFGDGSTGIGSNPIHNYSAAGNYTVCLIIQTFNGCIDSVCNTIQVPAFNQCSAIISYQTSNYNGIFSGSSTGGTVNSWAWYFSDGTTASGQNVTHTFAAAGFYNVCLYITTTNGCFDSTCQQVYIPGPTGICQPYFTYSAGANNVVLFTNQSQGNPTNYYWNFGDGSSSTSVNPTHTYAQSGMYIACLTVVDSSAGCSATYCDTLYINTTAICQASFTTTYQGNLIQFLNNSTGSYTQVYWDFGDGTNSTIISPWHQFAQPGVYTVCLTVEDSATSCFDTYCQTVVFQGTGNCDASFTTVDSAGFTWFFPTNYNPNYYYYWSFGDGNSSTQSYPIHQYATQGTFLACLTVIDSSTNCFISSCDSVSNLPPSGCIAGFSYQVSNGTSYFNGFNSGLGGIASYAWTFGDGTSGTGSNPIHNYSASGIYTVCLIIQTFNGCIDSVCNTIQVPAFNQCSAIISYQTSNYNGIFSGSSTGGTVNSWAWYFSDGTTASGQNVTHTFSAAGFYNVCLYITTTNGCFDSTCQQVYIPGPTGICQPYFTYSAGVNNVVLFTNQSQGNPTNYYWTFGDGSSSTSVNPTHTYAQSGMYIACLTVVDSSAGCSATYCDTIIAGNVIGNCNAQFQYFDSLGTYYYFPISNPNYYYHWNFGDGFVSNAMYPSHYYSTGGWYTVCLTVIDSLNNCADTWCDSIYVPNAAGCQAYFTYSIDTVTNAVSFTNQSQGAFTNSIWSFGDGTSSTSTSPSHVYTVPGTYLVCLTILGNNCQDSYCDSVVIGSGVNCIPQLYAVPDTTFGNGNVYFFIGNTCPGWQYVWNFGDSTTGAGSGPITHQYNATGWYTVCITAYDNFGNSITICDSVYALRLASGIDETISASSFNLFPNPSQGTINIQFELSKAAPITIEILSIQGQLIQSRVQEHPSGVSQMRFDLSALESGMYLIRIKTAEEQINSRFSIQQ